MTRSAKLQDRVRRRLPGAPRWLGPAGRREWRRAIRELEHLGFLELPTDLPALAAYCQLCDSPAALEPEWRELIFDYAGDLGLTPQARREIRRALHSRSAEDPRGVAKRKAIAGVLWRFMNEIEREPRAACKRQRAEDAACGVEVVLPFLAVPAKAPHNVGVAAEPAEAAR